MAKPKMLGKLALATAFAAALTGCNQSPGARNETVSKQNTVVADSGMHVVNEYDRYLDRYADFMTNQLCEGKTGNSSSLTCRNFESLSPAQRAYVEDLGVLLHSQDVNAVRPGTREIFTDHIVVNPASGVFNEYGRYYERYVDFKTEMLCVSKTGSSSSPVCLDFSNLTPAQKDYVDAARRDMDKAAQPKPK